mmetsp:Transcript_5545/g.12297  ORF Transcript_5545/g.12297 Transcript_5545/m.12297 type:complete len:518 (+) Transcript_5545:2-1555(+)
MIVAKAPNTSQEGKNQTVAALVPDGYQSCLCAATEQERRNVSSTGNNMNLTSIMASAGHFDNDLLSNMKFYDDDFDLNFEADENDLDRIEDQHDSHQPHQPPLPPPSSRTATTGHTSPTPTMFSISDGSDATSPASTAMMANQLNFPVLLHEIISRDEYDSISWLPCGTKFVITDKDAFARTVLPRYFDARGTTKYTSFTRRLKRWKFSRVPKGSQMGAYYHADFLRDDPELAKRINYPDKKKMGTTATKVVKKARRRASTGCINMAEAAAAVSFAAKGSSYDDMISPVPLKTSVELSSTPPLPDLGRDMTDFLSSPEFNSEEPLELLEEDANIPSLPTPSTPPSSSSVHQPTLVVSDSSIARGHQMQNYTVQHQSMQMPRPVFPAADFGPRVFHPAMRRHSCTIVNSHAVPSMSLHPQPILAHSFMMSQLSQDCGSSEVRSFNPEMIMKNNHNGGNSMGILASMMQTNVPNISERCEAEVELAQPIGSKGGYHDDKAIDFDEYLERLDHDGNDPFA